MLRAYLATDKDLVALPEGADLARASWIDLFAPTPQDVASLAALGVDVPTLADMEEIEISNRLYLQGDLAYMTCVIPGQNAEGQVESLPVSFILGPQRLVTVRHHEPRPFVTFPGRAAQSSCGATTPERIYVGLLEEIVGRMADLLEGAGRELDRTSAQVLSNGEELPDSSIRGALVTVGRSAEQVSRVRLCLMTLERMLVFHIPTIEKRTEASKLKPTIAAIQLDIHALQVHSDFLDARINLAVDATMGMINLRQNTTVKILSVVAALFLPPTLIASMYGMNFHIMPELDWRWGYPLALGAMVASSVATFVILRWKKWL
ncbi:magnesium transporter CorA family protein [Paracoccus sp. (in: a-proteobacteria)]|uniref:magnesium transporter CorA family protein n=1 Tax=Paracoccus sp. TaxID=267 RepID=UPI00289E22E6|nr:magnesium transporter CorA family protein [Paracoccus sp. (in: a-proteobacteria)]